MWILLRLTEDERSHLRVPETGLVTEVDAGFQHLTHGDCSGHENSKRVRPPFTHKNPVKARHPLARMKVRILNVYPA